ncbi:NAD(P)-binding domain-containing protein [Vreelandella aquamarina]|nr:NAD(P)-binding domain-containing protein [Halomonas meridiana]
MTTSRTIGFIGTGIMGAPMAARLADAGHQVLAWNRTKNKTDRLRSYGIEVVDLPEEAAAQCDIVIVMLSSGPVCDEILLARISHEEGSMRKEEAA